jgi:hypothetical protein
MAWTGAAALAINQDAEIGAPANVLWRLFAGYQRTG